MNRVAFLDVNDTARYIDTDRGVKDIADMGLFLDGTWQDAIGRCQWVFWIPPSRIFQITKLPSSATDREGTE